MNVQHDVWAYAADIRAGADLSGFKVEALDGSIGKIDDATNDVGASYIVVDTGPWIFGKKVMLPAGVISDIDYDTESVFVNRDKETIKNAPEFDDDFRSSDYRSRVGDYYGPGGTGYREPGSS
jgi:voltage-gated potassium channel Kch